MVKRKYSRYHTLLARYVHTGCPGQQFEDVCSDPESCASEGCCKIIRQQHLEREDGEAKETH